MRCPICGSENQKVKDSRHRQKGKIRYRKCFNCGSQFTTIETYFNRTVKAVQSERFLTKDERRAYNINQIKALARKMNIKLAEETCEQTEKV